jgi:p38 MAP kinase
MCRYSEILDFHNIDQGNDAGQVLMEGGVAQAHQNYA